MSELPRCGWKPDDPLLVRYHDEEWGVPAWDDRFLFEHLVLEGAQAGLSWLTILKRRAAYQRAFAGFDPTVIAVFGAEDVARLVGDPGIIRNRKKIESVVTNSRAVLKVREEFGSFAHYLWRFVGGRPIQNGWRTLAEIPTETAESRAMSADLKQRGFRFVGPTSCYALMQAVGMMNDHLVTCFRYGRFSGTRSGASSPGLGLDEAFRASKDTT